MAGSTQALQRIPTSAAEFEALIKAVPGLEAGGRQVAHGIHHAVLAGDERTRAVIDILHGTGTGHPLHPALTDIPVGSWILAALFDAYAVVGGGDFARRAADTLIGIGLLGAVPTALAGLADYSAIDEDALAVGAAHGALNGSAMALYFASLVMRKRNRRGLGILLSLAGLGLMGAAAALGGDLIYRLGVGVNHTPQPKGPQQWTQVLAANDLAEHQGRRVELDGMPILLYRDGTTIYAIGAVCSHAGGPLDEGAFDGSCVECPWHQSVFDMRDGSIVHGPATTGQPAYDTRIRDGMIEVRVRQPGAAMPAKANDAPGRRGEPLG